ncbi:WD40-repeat-containing domain [Pseudocohnilembus persalinus]|uniref:WD40-repeat-containing domain n=1 Tax=Pseudocohnilembus persalinus TaxID=266149 RepID=A0A0V0Q8N3_PSEPJ|nr:WD40-repeat-containing domain [Pseudocohnilembus persalinus]|eukprot:KRW98388.1 WD40-repeat-containing domain [Pseudocohnilembus persalinus]
MQIQNLTLEEFNKIKDSKLYKVIDVRSHEKFQQQFIKNSINVEFSNGYDEKLVAFLKQQWKDYHFILVAEQSMHKQLLKEIKKIFDNRVKAVFQFEKWIQYSLPLDVINSFKQKKEVEKYSKDLKGLFVYNIKSSTNNQQTPPNFINCLLLAKQDDDKMVFSKSFSIQDFIKNPKQFIKEIPQKKDIFIYSRSRSSIIFFISILKKEGFNKAIDISPVFDQIKDTLQIESSLDLPDNQQNQMISTDDQDSDSSSKQENNLNNDQVKTNNNLINKKKPFQQEERQSILDESYFDNIPNEDSFYLVNTDQIRKYSKNSQKQQNRKSQNSNPNFNPQDIKRSNNILDDFSSDSESECKEFYNQEGNIEKNKNTGIPSQNNKKRESKLSVTTKRQSQFSQANQATRIKEKRGSDKKDIENEYLKYKQEKYGGSTLYKVDMQNQKQNSPIHRRSEEVKPRNQNQNQVYKRGSLNSNTSSDLPDSEIQDSEFYDADMHFTQQKTGKQRTKTIIYFNPSIDREEQTLMQIGEGASGQVKQIIDWKQKVFYAIKTFKGENAYSNYKREKNTYESLKLTFGNQVSKLESYSMLLNRADDKNYSLYYNLGLCTLKEFNEYRKKKQIKWKKKELLYIFKRLVEFVLLMNEYKYFHGDIKPMNIVLQEVEEQLQVKVIDFAGSSQDWKFHSMITPLYFNHYKRKKYLINHPEFESQQERLKNELYTVVRVFQDICVHNSGKKELKDLFSLGTDENKNLNIFQTEEKLNRLMEALKIEYQDLYQEKDFQQFFDFIQNKMITEDYDINELQTFIKNDKIFPQDEQSIEDEGQICKNIIQDKLYNNKKNKFDQDPMEELFKLETYQLPQCTVSESSQQRHDLLDQVYQFFASQTQQIFIIYGDSGQGKASFLLYLKDKLQDLAGIQESKKFFNLGVYYIKLIRLREVEKLKSYLNEIFNRLEKNTGTLFLVEGYDELLTPRVDISTLFRLEEYPMNKLILTTRKEHLPQNQISQIFQFHSQEKSNQSKNLNKSLSQIRNKVSLAYIALFDEQQIKEFIQTYIDIVSKKKYYYNVEFYDTVEMYIKKLDLYPELRHIISIPLILRIALEVLPTIDKEIQAQEKLKTNKLTQIQLQLRNFQKYNLFKKFLQNWVERNLQNHCQSLKDLDDQFLKSLKVIENKIEQTNQYLSEFMFLEDNKYIDTSLLKKQLGNDENNFKLFLKCSIIKQVEKQYTFAHQSMYEFYVASNFINGISNHIKRVKTGEIEEITLDLVKEEIINKKFLTMQHFPIIEMITTYFKSSPFEELEILRAKVFLPLINSSKQFFSKAASNSATLYNLMNFPFSGLDLSNAQLSYSLLQSALFYKTKLKNSNLSKANLTGAILTNADISGANLNHSDFGNLPDLLGHEQGVNCVDFDQHSDSIISGGKDSTIRLWSIEQAEEVRIFLDYSPVNALKFSNDCRNLISGNNGKRIAIWQTDSGQEKCNFTGHIGKVNSVAYSPDEFYIASGGEDSFVILWETSTSKQKHSFKEHTKAVNEVNYSPSGKFLVSGGQDSLIIVYNIQKLEILFKLQGHIGSVNSVNFTQDGKCIVSAGFDKSIRLWDFKLQTQKYIIGQAHQRGINKVITSLDGKYMGSCSDDTIVKIWDLESSKLLKQLQGHEKPVKTICFSPNGKYIASGGDDTIIKIWDLESHYLLNKNNGNDSKIKAVKFSNDGKVFAVGEEDKVIRIFDSQTYEEMYNIPIHLSEIKEIQFSQNNNQILTNSEAKIINLENLQSTDFINIELPNRQTPIISPQYQLNNNLWTL